MGLDTSIIIIQLEAENKRLRNALLHIGEGGVESAQCLAEYARDVVNGLVTNTSDKGDSQ